MKPDAAVLRVRFEELTAPELVGTRMLVLHAGKDCAHFGGLSEPGEPIEAKALALGPEGVAEIPIRLVLLALGGNTVLVMPHDTVLTDPTPTQLEALQP